MDRIFVGIYDEHKLVKDGIRSLLQQVKEFEIIISENNKVQLLADLKLKTIHILIINLHSTDIQSLNLITNINILFPKIKILVISVHNDENTILKTIKAGAKGFLAKETDPNELAEALFSLRNGFDYFSKSITHLLLNKYISKIKLEDNDFDPKMNTLSLREIEIVKLWGNSFTNNEIADKLFISVRTVESHKNHIMQKLNLKTAVDLVKFAIKNNIIEI